MLEESSDPRLDTVDVFNPCTDGLGEHQKAYPPTKSNLRSLDPITFVN